MSSPIIQCINTSNANYIVEHMFMYSAHHHLRNRQHDFLAEQLWHIYIHMRSTEQFFNSLENI